MFGKFPRIVQVLKYFKRRTALPHSILNDECGGPADGFFRSTSDCRQSEVREVHP
jgi:hypothetical protein